jgi:hypothetical protein
LEDEFFLLPSGFYFHCFDGESSTTEALKIQANEGVEVIMTKSALGNSDAHEN